MTHSVFSAVENGRIFLEFCGQASERPYFVLNLTSNLSALGHIDVQHDVMFGIPSAWRCAPPAAVLLPGGGAILSGFRSKEMLRAVKDSIEAAGGNFNRLDQIDAPYAYKISELEPTAIETAIANIKDPHGRSLKLAPNPAAIIAQNVPAISTVQALMEEIYIRASDPLEQFDPASGYWKATDNSQSPGAYRSTAGTRTYAFRNRKRLSP